MTTPASLVPHTSDPKTPVDDVVSNLNSVPYPYDGAGSLKTAAGLRYPEPLKGILDFNLQVSPEVLVGPEPVELVATPFGTTLRYSEPLPSNPAPPSWGSPQPTSEFGLALATVPETGSTEDDDDEEVREVVWTEHQRKAAHRIWLDTVEWEKNPQLANILAYLDDESNNLPVFHLKTYSCCDRPRRTPARRRFPVSECWMFFSDVDHAVWIDCNGFPDLTRRSHDLVKEEYHRVFIPSCKLGECTVEQLKEQQDLLAELKRYTESRPDTDFVHAQEHEDPEQEDSSSESSADEGESEEMTGTSGEDTEAEEGVDEEDDEEDEAMTAAGEGDDSTESDDLI